MSRGAEWGAGEEGVKGGVGGTEGEDWAGCEGGVGGGGG